MPTYDKLVRDLIPDIIRADGKTCTTRILSDTDYLHALDTKLDEEIKEYRSAKPEHALEELADIMEIIHALAQAHGFSVAELESVRAAKAKERGGFQKKIFLQEVHR